MKLKIVFIFGGIIVAERIGYNTRQREKIMDVLLENKGRHMTVDELVYRLKENGVPVGVTTVYRYLELLEKQGLVRKYSAADGGSACFEYLPDPSSCTEHFHFKCTGCGKLYHVDCSYLNDLEAHLKQEHHLRIDNSKTVLYGLCSGCSREKGEQK